jgi:hypothetical protein
MGLIVVSIIFAIILGSCTWLVAGDQFPLGEEAKWPIVNNILVYAAILVIPVYLTIFFTF